MAFDGIPRCLFGSTDNSSSSSLFGRSKLTGNGSCYEDNTSSFHTRAQHYTAHYHGGSLKFRQSSRCSPEKIQQFNPFGSRRNNKVSRRHKHRTQRQQTTNRNKKGKKERRRGGKKGEREPTFLGLHCFREEVAN